jgi:hypothetical protein
VSGALAELSDDGKSFWAKGTSRGAGRSKRRKDDVVEERLSKRLLLLPERLRLPPHCLLSYVRPVQVRSEHSPAV